MYLLLFEKIIRLLLAAIWIVERIRSSVLHQNVLQMRDKRYRPDLLKEPRKRGATPEERSDASEGTGAVQEGQSELLMIVDLEQK